MAQFSFLPTTEASELSDDVRELFEEIAQATPGERHAYSGEYRPALDVRETDQIVEVIVDAAGVSANALRVRYREGVLLIVGAKAAAPYAGAQSFHLVEREFGRFARGVRLPGAFDLAQASATLQAGELRIVLPKIVERRGRAHRIAITSPARSQA